MIVSVTVPVNTTARVHLPVGNADEVVESGRVITMAREIKVIGMEAGRVVVEIGSGKYEFLMKEEMVVKK